MRPPCLCVCLPPPLSILCRVTRVILLNCKWALVIFPFTSVSGSLCIAYLSIKSNPLTTPRPISNICSTCATRKLWFFFCDWNVCFSFFCLLMPSHPYLICRVAWAMLPSLCSFLPVHTSATAQNFSLPASPCH